MMSVINNSENADKINQELADEVVTLRSLVN